DGIIGNIYSTGLALQVLGATRRFYAPREWDCGQAFSVVAQHDFQQPTAIAQLLPALLGKSYLDAASRDCPPPSSLLALSPWLGTTQGDRAPIQVSFSITNQLQGIPFSFTTRVRVPGGSTLLQVLQAAEKEEPEVFSFQTEPSSWGPMVVSIHGVAANPQDRTYWEFLSAGNPLQGGVGSYKPRDEEHIQAVLSTY
ncbi:Gastric intrinsic factor, partial [Calypte anna]